VKRRGRPAKKPVARVKKPVVKLTISSEKPKMTLSKQLEFAAAEGVATANTGPDKIMGKKVMSFSAFTHYRKTRQSLRVPGYYSSTPGKSITTFQRTTT
jgi:hypothetical protein